MHPNSVSATPDRTLSMTFKNDGFMFKKLSQECAPLQFLRELTKNSLEAILRTEKKKGDILWDYDETAFNLNGLHKLSITDNGDGMTGPEMVEYINKVSSSISTQSFSGNYGVGAKISAATRNPEGLVYLSWKEGKGSMIQLWYDPQKDDYGLKGLPRPDGTYAYWAPISDELKPKLIGQHGTKVILLGKSFEENTLERPKGQSGGGKWIPRYLNTRFLNIPEGIKIRAREDHILENLDKSDSSRLRTITGQLKYIEKHAQAKGQVPLENATAHWWILKNNAALETGWNWIANTGHVAAIYQNEIYEPLYSRAGVGRLQQFGVTFGYKQVVIYVKPLEDTVTTNTARTKLLINGDDLPWHDWAEKFRNNLPQPISDLIDQVVSGSKSASHQATIRERLKKIFHLFRLSRYRPAQKGRHHVSGKNLTLGGEEGPPLNIDERRTQSETDKSRSRGKSARAGNVYSMFMSTEGMPAKIVLPDTFPKFKWVSVAEKTREPEMLEDRAARFLPEQNLVLANADFRVFTDMIEHFVKVYEDKPGGRATITSSVHSWFEQVLTETILGTQVLKDSREWSPDDIKKCTSEEALTAAVLPRYHINNSVKRELGTKLGAPFSQRA